MTIAPLTAEERTVLTTRLTEAESAYHTLRLGQQARVVVDQNGERVEFAVANRAALQAYITELKMKLGQPVNITGPLNVWTL